MKLTLLILAVGLSIYLVDKHKKPSYPKKDIGKYDRVWPPRRYDT